MCVCACLICRMWSAALIHAVASVDSDNSLSYIQTHGLTADLHTEAHAYGALSGHDYILLPLPFLFAGVKIHDLILLTDL